MTNLRSRQFFVQHIILAQHLSALLDEDGLGLRILGQTLPQIVFGQHEQVRVAHGTYVRRPSVSVLIAWYAYAGKQIITIMMTQCVVRVYRLMYKIKCHVKTILQGSIEGNRRQGRPTMRWQGNIVK